MKKLIAVMALLLPFGLTCMAKSKTVTIKIVQTSDVHGSFFPYDYINRRPMAGSMARVSSYVKQLREQHGDNVILLDNGDILQGQPICYYSNYIDTTSENIAASVVNYLKYDAQTIGNHDVEPGHEVYDKWIKEVKCPVIAANIIDTNTGKPYLKPYTILNRVGAKIAVLGMITPAIPNWLTERLWSGLSFVNMVTAAREWVNYLKANEKPDVIIGLFHSGKEGGIVTADYEEDAALKVAREVDGFDLILFGHDHTPYADFVTSESGNKVLCLDPANAARKVAEATITIEKGKKHCKKSVEGQLVDVRDIEVDKEYMAHFEEWISKINAFVNKKIGTFANSISTRDCYFGSSAFNDLILNLELKITGADIAFNAPLLFDAQINKGDIYVSDMFKLYKYENQLYVMRLTGEEIRKHLEMSYSLWVNTMQSPDDHLLLLNEYTKNDQQRMGFQNFSFNFDSAAGIDYEVDVTKPNGQKVTIHRMSNGQPFDPKAWYKVAVNSYRGNGGGELLTRGAGISHDSLESRIIWRSDKDQRYYLMKAIESEGTLDPQPNNNWRFVPEQLVKPAAKRDYELLFNRKK